MKAFQLKVMIKNSKPPIWRRVVVPSGITFSQLSMIFNEVMGWYGYHLFEFEFYHMNLHIIENTEEFSYEYSMFDYEDAATTYIGEYLEENNWFTYTYDLGDCWEHRVTVEKVIYDYEYNYPMILKYKGDCPIEDSGGIYGYYNCQEIINDKTYPEYEEISEWMNMQGYPTEYDMDYVNDELERRYYYKWGKGEKRCQAKMYEDMFKGKYGLKATENDKNISVAKKNKKLADNNRNLNDVISGFNEILKYEKILQEMLANRTLQDIFADFNKEDIYEIAKEKGLKGISSYNKVKLITSLTDYMLQPEIAKEYFVWLQEEEINELEKVISSNNLYVADDIDNLLKLYKAGYIGMIEDGEITITNDVCKLYSDIKTPKFEDERRKKSYLYCCLQAVSSLYGIAPMSVLLQLLGRNDKIIMSETEVVDAIYSMPPEYNEWVLTGGKIYQKEYYPNDFGLQNIQANKGFYIPTFQEICSYGKMGYKKNIPECKKLKKFMMTKMSANEEDADLACEIIHQSMSMECSMHEIFNIMDDMGLYIENESQINELMECIIELQNNTRKIVNRGYTPNELHKMERNVKSPVSITGNIISYEKAKKTKIYPNAPCPCGSGKKYKNCCKNK